MKNPFKTKIKKAHLFAVSEVRNKFYMPSARKRQKTVWQQVYTLLF